MFNRIVSLALIICFLPLPNVDSAGARDLMIAVFGGAETGPRKTAQAEHPDDNLPRWVLNHSDFEGSERLVFLEMEKEVRENESKDGEDKFFDEFVYVGTETGNRLTTRSMRAMLSIRMQSVETIFSRFHLLRC